MSTTGEMLAHVRYTILFVKLGYEAELAKCEILTTSEIDPPTFSSQAIATFIRALESGQTRVPHEWEQINYPGTIYRERGILKGLPEQDKLYLRATYEVLNYYPRESVDKYSEQQIRALQSLCLKLG